jgi:hypothetical protein
MIDYIIYDDNGQILRTGKCPQSMLDAQCGENENIIQGIAQDDKHQIIDGLIVDKDVDKAVDNSIKLNELRQQRNILLSQTDWTQIPDAPLSSEQKQQWATYRQQLRDLPSLYSTETNIDNVVFPEIP